MDRTIRHAHTVKWSYHDDSRRSYQVHAATRRSLLAALEMGFRALSPVHYADTKKAEPILLGRESLLDGRPIHDVPPGAEVIGPAVLVLQIIGVLPDVDAHHRELAFHDWAVLIGRRDDVEFA